MNVTNVRYKRACNLVESGVMRQKILDNKADGKAILRELRSVKKQFPFGWNRIKCAYEQNHQHSQYP